MTLVGLCIAVAVIVTALAAGPVLAVHEVPGRYLTPVAGTAGLAGISIVAGWGAAFGLRAGAGLILILVVAAIGWSLALLRRRVSRRTLGHCLPALGVVTLLTCVFALGTSGGGDAWRFRIGPDAIGYVTSGAVLADGATKAGVAAELRAQTGAGQEDIFDTGKVPVQSAPSLQSQVSAEFLLGANRWGLPFAIAATSLVAGADAIWLSAGALIGLALSLTAVGIWTVVRRRAGPGLALAAGACAVAGSSVLNAWLEGGLGQIWIMPLCVGLVWLLMDVPGAGRTRSILVAAILWAGIITSYQDGAVLMLAVTGGFGVLAVILDRSLLPRSLWLLAGALASLLVVGPFSSTLLEYVQRRTRDASAGGWWQPQWLSPAEFLGVGNGYPDPRAALWPRSSLSEAVAVMISVLLLAWIAAILRRAGRDPSVVLVLAAAVVAVAVFGASRYVMQTSNYQFSKAAASLSPVFAAGIAVAVAKAREQTHDGRFGALARSVVIPGYALFVTAVLLGGGLFAGQFLRDSTPLPQSLVSQAYANRELLGGLDVVSDGGLVVNAVSSVADLRLISRSDAARVRSRDDGLPLAVIVPAGECGPVCARTAVPLGPDYAMVVVAESSQDYTEGSREAADSWLASSEGRSGIARP